MYYLFNYHSTLYHLLKGEKDFKLEIQNKQTNFNILETDEIVKHTLM